MPFGIVPDLAFGFAGIPRIIRNASLENTVSLSAGVGDYRNSRVVTTRSVAHRLSQKRFPSIAEQDFVKNSVSPRS